MGCGTDFAGRSLVCVYTAGEQRADGEQDGRAVHWARVERSESAHGHPAATEFGAWPETAAR